MKQILILLLLFCAVVAPAQVLRHLQNLEGTWYRDDRREACYTQWEYRDAQTLVNRTFGFRCGDTLQFSRAIIHATETGATLTMQTDSLGGMQQTFKLMRSTNEHLFWENENAMGRPRQLNWEFFGSTSFVFRADDAETGYRRKYGWRNKITFEAGIGLNRSNLYKSLALGSQDYKYAARLGGEFALSIGVRNPDNPIACAFELGVRHRSTDIFAKFQDPQKVVFNRVGTLSYTSLYLAFIPEILFGKSRNFSLSPGIFLDLASTKSLRSANPATPAGTQGPQFGTPQPFFREERGVLLGASWSLPKKWIPGYQPVLYARGTMGLYNHVRTSTLSAGLKFRLNAP